MSLVVLYYTLEFTLQPRAFLSHCKSPSQGLSPRWLIMLGPLYFTYKKRDPLIGLAPMSPGMSLYKRHRLSDMLHVALLLEQTWQTQSMFWSTAWERKYCFTDTYKC